MTLLRNLRIGARMRLAFGGLAAAVLLTGMIGFHEISQMNALSVDLLTSALPSTRILGDYGRGIERFRNLQAQSLLNQSLQGIESARQRGADAQANVEKARAAYTPLIDDGEERNTLIPALDDAWKNYLEESRKLDDPALRADPARLGTFFAGDLLQSFNRLRGTVDAEVAYNLRTADRRSKAADAAMTAASGIMVGITLLSLALAVFAAIWVQRRIVSGVVHLSGVARGLARRDYQFDLPDAARADELGDLSRAVDECRTGLKEADRLAAANAAEQAAKAERGARLEELSRHFEARAAQMTQVLASATTELQATAESMTGSANRVTERASAVSAASTQASGNVQTVAVATEELASSVSEISRQVATSAAAAEKASQEAEQTKDVVRHLASGAERIGEVIGLIQSIASQTNLLALNATIEAARAGDAGKGFAVVASEVKQLASQTGKATEDITTQISQIQSATQDAVKAIGAITDIIEEVGRTTAAISAAVEEQGAATQEIARNVQQAAAGTQEVSTNIEHVVGAAGESGQSARDVLTAASQLSQETEDLNREVRTFLDGVRAA